MKAGTAQKVVLNLLSTQIMLLLGRVWRGQMVDMVARNEKLRRRALRMVRGLTGASEEQSPRGPRPGRRPRETRHSAAARPGRRRSSHAPRGSRRATRHGARPRPVRYFVIVAVALLALSGGARAEPALVAGAKPHR
ncbi:MAG: hypothetical protein WDN04_19460 [Rhodospirillales bacterium]